MPALIYPGRRINRGVVTSTRRFERGIKRIDLDHNWKCVVVCASGPSFSHEQAALLNDRLMLDALGWKVIVVNTTYQKLPTADALYAGDRTWWDVHLDKVRKQFTGECWTVNRWIAHNAGLCHVDHSNEPGLSRVAGRIHTGGNSGYAAIGLAYLFGAREILLVGFDFQDTYGMSHWHGDHPKELSQSRPFEGWLNKLPLLLHGLQEQGVRVINCSIETAIPEGVIPRGDLTECLCRS